MANVAMVRHPDYADTPHFYLEIVDGYMHIHRLDDLGPLALLKNEHGMTTYTFQIKEKDLINYFTERSTFRSIRRILFETTKVNVSDQYESVSDTIYAYEGDTGIHTSPTRYTNYENLRWVDSTSGKNGGISFYEGMPGVYDIHIPVYDTLCFSYTFTEDFWESVSSDFQFSIRIAGPLNEELFALYSEPVAVLNSKNLCDNPHAKIHEVRHPDYKDTPHFYIDSYNLIPSSNIAPIYLTEGDEVVFTSTVSNIVTFQMARIMKDGTDVYDLTNLVINAKIGDATVGLTIKAAKGKDRFVYISSSDPSKYVIDPDVAPDPSIYDTVCFSWDMTMSSYAPGKIAFSVEGHLDNILKFKTEYYNHVEHRSMITITDGKVYHPDYPTAPHFSIDAVTRDIRLLTDDVISLGLQDQNGTRLTFQVSRMLTDTRDLYDTTSTHVLFVNTSGADIQDKKNGSSTIKQFVDKQPSLSTGLNDIVYVDSSNGEVFRVRYDEITGKYTKPPERFNVMCFSWVVPADATTKAGNLSFTVRFAKTVQPDKYVYHSNMYTGVSVTDTLNFGIVLEDAFNDTLSEWFDQFCMAQVQTEGVITDLIDKATSDVNNRYETIIKKYTESINKLTEDTVTELRDFAADAKDELESLGGVSVSPEQPTSSRVVAWLDTSTDNNPLGTRLLEDSDIGGNLNWYRKIDITNNIGDDDDCYISAFEVSEKGYVYGSLNGKLNFNTSSEDYMYGIYRSIKPGTYDVSTYRFASSKTTSKLTYYIFVVDADENIVTATMPKPTSGTTTDRAGFFNSSVTVPVSDSVLDLYVVSAGRKTYDYGGSVHYTETKDHDILGSVPFMIEQSLTEDVSSDIHESLVSPNTEATDTGWVYGATGFPAVVVDDSGSSNYTTNFRYIKVDNVSIGTYDITTRAIVINGDVNYIPNYACLVDSQGIVIRTSLPSSGAPETSESSEYIPYTGEITVTSSDIINNDKQPLTLYLVHARAEVNGVESLYWSVTKRGSKDNSLNTIIKAIQGETPSMTIGRQLVDSARGTIMGYNRSRKCLNFAWITDTHINGNQGNRETVAYNNLRLFGELTKERFLDFAVTGGDMFTARETDLSDAFKYIGESMRYIGNSPIPLFNVKGNHDNNAKKFIPVTTPNWNTMPKYYYLNEETGYYQALTKSEYEALATKPALYTMDEDNAISSYQWAMLMQNNVDAVFDTTNPYGGYFYKDFTVEKIRVLVINDFDNYIGDEFATWSDNQKAFINSAFELPDDDWGVVVLTHTVLTKPTSGVNSRYEAIKNHASKIICYIHGHDHKDLSVPKSDGQWLTIGTNAGYGELIKGEVGTADEFSIDIFTIDPVNRKIYDTRIGRGESREFSY